MTTLPQTITRLIIHPKTVVPRTSELRELHDIARKLGYETRLGLPGRDEYERELMRLVGVRSLKNASRYQRGLVLEAFTAELAMRRLHLPVVEITTDDEALAILGLL